MSLSRRRLLGTTAAVLPGVVLTSGGRAGPKPADLSTPEGWLSWAADHPRQIALSIDDGRGASLRYRADARQPLASAVKVAHLAAYAHAVADGALDPHEPIRVGDWERFYLPTDGGAHGAALDALSIPTDATGVYAANPEHRVELDRMVAVMIQFSDSAVPDFLRDRLGEPAVRRAAASGGWPRADIRSMCAEYLFLVLPEHAPPPDASVPHRRAVGLRLEQHYSTDPALRQHALRRLMAGTPPYPEQELWASGTVAATPTEVAALHHSVAVSSQRWATIARDHLRRPFRDRMPPGVVDLGFKGGSLPGVLTGGMFLRRSDDSTAAGCLLVHGGITAEQLSSGDPALALRLALDDPVWRNRLVRALGNSGTLDG